MDTYIITRCAGGKCVYWKRGWVWKRQMYMDQPTLWNWLPMSLLGTHCFWSSYAYGHSTISVWRNDRLQARTSGESRHVIDICQCWIITGGQWWWVGTLCPWALATWMDAWWNTTHRKRTRGDGYIVAELVVIFRMIHGSTTTHDQHDIISIPQHRRTHHTHLYTYIKSIGWMSWKRKQICDAHTRMDAAVDYDCSICHMHICI